MGSGAPTKVIVPATFMYGADLTNNIAAAVQSCGYTTGMVGKWHLTPSNETGGNYGDAYTDQQAQVRQSGFDYVDGLYISNLNTCTDDCTSFTHNMEWVTEKALEFMNGAIEASTPFFLFFNPTMPHTPHVKEALDGTFDEYGTPAGTLTSLPDLTQYCSSCSFKTRTKTWQASSGLATGSADRSVVSSVYWVDQAVGVVYDYLTEKGALENTYIIVSSDNGEAKGTAYEQGTRTSLFVRGPTVAAGKTVTELVSNIDLAPTIMEWTGATSTSGLDVDGVSWASVAAGTSSSLDRTEIFVEMVYDRAVINSGYKKYYSAGEGDYENKVASDTVSGWYPAWGTGDQLYDLSSDDAEQTDIASSDTSTLSSLQTLMTAHKAATLNNPATSTTLSCTTASPTAAPVGDCQSWCSTNTNDWDTKCGWTNCASCDDCTSASPTAAPTVECQSWCSTNTNDWDTKCGWTNCASCDDCTSAVVNAQLTGKQTGEDFIKEIMSDIRDANPH
jgi:arylsulfatase A-like enzyme